MSSYNPNSKYGRRRNREALQERYNAMTPDQKKEWNKGLNQWRFALFVIVMVVCLIVIALGGKIK
jgi:hypothetical protein